MDPVADARARADDHRQTARHGLEDRQIERVLERRGNIHVGGSEEIKNIATGRRKRDSNPAKGATSSSPTTSKRKGKSPQSAAASRSAVRPLLRQSLPMRRSTISLSMNRQR